jgi:hypothetical protein
MHTVTTVKAKTTHNTLAEALAACAAEPHASAAFGPSIEFPGGAIVSIADGTAITIEERQELAEAESGAPRWLVRVYRAPHDEKGQPLDRGPWCYALWIGGEFDASSTLDDVDDADGWTEVEAAARAQFPGAEVVSA